MFPLSFFDHFPSEFIRISIELSLFLKVYYVIFMTDARPQNLEIMPVDPREKDCRAMIEDLDSYQADLYPAESNHLDDIKELLKPHVHFLGALHNGQLVGCGAIKLCHSKDKFGELKRMYVLPAARGMGVGRKILSALEAVAARHNIFTVRLETGVSQPEALQLYERCGYQRTGPFGDYQLDPLSVFMEKHLDMSS